MPTVSEVISIAKVSQYLAEQDLQNKGLFGGGQDRLLPQKLFNIRKSLSYWYDLDSSDDNLIKVANYLYALCGAYNLEAAVIVSAGSSGTVPSAGGSQVIQSPIRITQDDFTNATDWDGDNGDGVDVRASYTLSIFWDDVSRFLTSSEYTRTTDGFEITISGFDATTNDYTFHVFISR
jgi:hypothetical protein